MFICLGLIMSCAKNSNQEGFGKIVFEALKRNNYKRYSNYIIRIKEVSTLFSALKQSEQYKKYPVKKRLLFDHGSKNIKLRYAQLLRKLRLNFTKTFDNGIQQGIIWSKTKFVKILIGKKENIFDLKNRTQQNVFIVFSHKNKKYKLRLKNNAKVKRGWVIVDGFYWETLAAQK